MCYGAWRIELTGKVKREIDRREEDGGEDVPAQHADNECQSATSGDARLCSCGVAESDVEVPGCQACERWDEQEEDQEKDQVGAEGADRVDNDQDAHAYKVESWTRISR